MDNKKKAALAALLIIALALVGVGYGLWFEDLQIDGMVTTGKLDVAFSPATVHEYVTSADPDDILVWRTHVDGGYEWFPPDTPFQLKMETTDCYAVLEDEGELNPLDNPDNVDTGPDLLKIMVTGAYPSYHCLVRFDITNRGTVPVHLAWDADEALAEELVENFVCFPKDGNGGHEGRNCTLTQGYWSTHSKYGPAPYDPNWESVGEDTPFFNSGQTWYEVLWTPPAGGDPYYILAQQYIAAVLNVNSGADPTAVATELALAETWFNTYNPGETKGTPAGADAIAWAGVLDDYNNGLIGPGHCDGRTIEDGDGDGNGEVIYLPYQLHEGEHLDCEILIHFDNYTTVNGDLVQEDTTYEFLYTIRAYQWNEDDAPALDGWNPFGF